MREAGQDLDYHLAPIHCWVVGGQGHRLWEAVPHFHSTQESSPEPVSCEQSFKHYKVCVMIQQIKIKSFIKQ